MSAGEPSARAEAAGGPSARADLVWSVIWLAVGAAIFYGGFAMDRLEGQNINPYTAPGLVPALLGIAIVLAGAVLLVRSLRRLGRDAAGMPPGTSWGRLALAAALCIGYAAGLVGRGLPFWLATALFVFVAIAALEWPERRARGQTARGLAIAAACALGTAAAVTLVFQEVFLVRLP